MADIATLGLRLDANGFVSGSNQVVAASNRMEAAGTKASAGVSRLRGALTTLAVSAGAIPGPFGRLASTLSMFAIGGGVTVGVLAGITAMTLAWNKYTEGARKAREMMRDIHQMESSFSQRAVNARVTSLQGQEASLAGRLSEVQSQRGRTFLREGPIGLALNLYRQEKLTDDLADVRQRIAQLAQLEAEVVRMLQGEAAVAKKFMTQTGAVAGFENAATLAGVQRPFGSPFGGIDERSFASQQKVNLEFEKEAMKARAQFAGAALAARLQTLEAERKINLALVEGNALFETQLTIAQQKAGAGHHLAGFGLGMLSNMAGPFGGMVSGIGQGIMSGNPFMAAASGITGLVDGLLSLSSASAAYREEMRRLQAQFNSYIDDIRLRVGAITPMDAELLDAQRQYEQQRAAISPFAGFDPNNPLHQNIVRRTLGQSALDQILKNFEELDKWYPQLIEAIKNNTDALTTSVRNAPSGFFVENYLSPFTSTPDEERRRRGPGRRRGPRIGSGMGGMDGTTINITVPQGGIQISGNEAPREIARKLVVGLREFANASGGNGTSLSTALDMVN